MPIEHADNQPNMRQLYASNKSLFRQSFNEIAQSKWNKSLIINDKGYITETNLLMKFIQIIKGWLGRTNWTSKPLIERKVVDFLDYGIQQDWLTSKDTTLIHQLASRVGLVPSDVESKKTYATLDECVQRIDTIFQNKPPPVLTPTVDEAVPPPEEIRQDSLSLAKPLLSLSEAQQTIHNLVTTQTIPTIAVSSEESLSQASTNDASVSIFSSLIDDEPLEELQPQVGIAVESIEAPPSPATVEAPVPIMSPILALALTVEVPEESLEVEPPPSPPPAPPILAPAPTPLLADREVRQIRLAALPFTAPEVENPIPPENLTEYLSAHLPFEASEIQTGAIGKYYQLITEKALPTNEKLDRCDEWLLRFLRTSLNVTNRDDTQQQAHFDPKVLVTKIGIQNAFVLLMRGYQFADQQRKLAQSKQDFSEWNKAYNAEKLFSNALQLLIASHLEEYRSLDLDKLKFTKAEVKTELLDKPPSTRNWKKITGVAIGALLVAAAGIAFLNNTATSANNWHEGAINNHKWSDNPSLSGPSLIPAMPGLFSGPLTQMEDFQNNMLQNQYTDLELINAAGFYVQQQGEENVAIALEVLTFMKMHRDERVVLNYLISCMPYETPAAKAVINRYQDITHIYRQGSLIVKTCELSTPNAVKVVDKYLNEFDNYRYLIPSEIISHCLNYETPTAQKVVSKYINEQRYSGIPIDDILGKQTSTAKMAALHIYEKSDANDKEQIAIAALHVQTPQAEEIALKHFKYAMDQKAYWRRDFVGVVTSSSSATAEKTALAYLNEVLIADREKALLLTNECLDEETMNPLREKVVETYFDYVLQHDSSAAHEFANECLSIKTPMAQKITETAFEKLWKTNFMAALAFAHRAHVGVDYSVSLFTFAAAIAAIIAYRIKKDTIPFNVRIAYGKVVDTFVRSCANSQQKQAIMQALSSIPQSKWPEIAMDCQRSLDLFPEEDKQEATAYMIRCLRDYIEDAKRKSLHDQLAALPANQRLKVVKLLSVVTAEQRFTLLQGMTRVPDAERNKMIDELAQINQRTPAVAVLETMLSTPVGNWEAIAHAAFQLVQFLPPKSIRLATILELMSFVPAEHYVGMAEDCLTAMRIVPAVNHKEQMLLHAVVIIFSGMTLEQRKAILGIIEEAPDEEMLVRLAPLLENIREGEDRVNIFRTIASKESDNIQQDNVYKALELIRPPQRAQCAGPLMLLLHNVNHPDDLSTILTGLVSIPTDKRSEALIFLASKCSIAVSGNIRAFILTLWEWISSEANRSSTVDRVLTFFFSLAEFNLTEETFYNLVNQVRLMPPDKRNIFFNFLTVAASLAPDVRSNHFLNPLKYLIEADANLINSIKEYLKKELYTYTPEHPDADCTLGWTVMEQASNLKIDTYNIVYVQAYFLWETANKANQSGRNPYAIYEKLTSTTRLEPLIQLTSNKKTIITAEGDRVSVQMSLAALRKRARARRWTFADLPANYKSQNFSSYFNAFEARYNPLTEAQKKQLKKEIQKVCLKCDTDAQLDELLRGMSASQKKSLDAATSYETLRATLDSKYLKDLISLSGEAEDPIEDSKRYLHSIFNRLEHTDGNAPEGRLSEREQNLFALAYHFRICSTGQDDGLLQYYNGMPIEFRVGGSQGGGSNAEKMIQCIDSVGIQQLFSAMLSREELLRKYKANYQASHQTKYLLNRLLKQLALNRSIAFDEYSQLLANRLITQMADNLVKEVLDAIPVKQMVQTVKAAVAENMKSGKITYAIVKDYLEPFISPGEKEAVDWITKYISFDEDFVPLNAVTDLGALMLLASVGYVSNIQIGDHPLTFTEALKKRIFG